ncbi:MAG: ankyrin repeat domain-containing protein, partial [Lysobacterales bacterium]
MRSSHSRFAAAIASCFLAAGAQAAEDLLRAAQRNDATVALAAIEDGVDVNARSPDGTTPLHWAVYNGNLALVERLIAAGADVAAA